MRWHLHQYPNRSRPQKYTFSPLGTLWVIHHSGMEIKWGLSVGQQLGFNCIQPQNRHATLAAPCPQILQAWTRTAFHLVGMFFITRFTGSRGLKAIFQPSFAVWDTILHVFSVSCSPVELMGTAGLASDHLFTLWWTTRPQTTLWASILY